jgi:hypothetical protein
MRSNMPDGRRRHVHEQGDALHLAETLAKYGLSSFVGVDADVVVVRWPNERSERDRLSALGRPRLLLVAPDVPAPAVEDPLEDWVRVPTADPDVRARIETLRRRAASTGGPVSEEPSLDDDGVLRWHGRWVSLPPVEARLTRALLDRFGAVVGREALARAGWPEGAPGRNALDVHMLRLRRRIATLAKRRPRGV